MLLRALREMPTTVNTIAAGQVFHEINDERAAEWIRSGYAEPVTVDERGNPVSASAKVFPSWPGATVVIIASGPSLTEEQCAEVRTWREAGTDNRFVIVINTSYRRAPFADILYACDRSWWDARSSDVDTRPHVKVVKELFAPEKLWTQDSDAAKAHGLNLIKSSREAGLSMKPGIINQGMSSGYQSINFAVLAGATRLILLGFDCKGKHWHEDHPPPCSNTLPHRQWKQCFEDLARDIRTVGVDVVNCSPGTALHTFREGTLSTELSPQQVEA